MACSSSMINEEIKLRILNNYARFVSDAEPDRLCDWLVQDGVISIEQSQKIQRKNDTNPERCRALLHHLFFTQHPTAFLTVRKALRERNHYLVQYIDSQESGCGFRGQSDTGAFSQEDQKSEERSKQEQKKIRTLEVNIENLMQDLNSEKIKNIELHTEFEKLRQELDNEKKSSKTCQTDLDQLMQKTVNEREHAKQLEKMMTAFQIWMSKLELKKTEKQEREQLIAKAQEEKKRIAEIRYRSDPVLIQRIGTRAAAEQNKCIRGLTILDNKLFILSNESSEIEVYDSLTLNFSRRLSLNELIQPQEIVSCSRNKCIYIMDFKVTGQSKEILIVDPNGKLKGKWSTGDDWGWHMSVTDDSNVILTIHDKNKLNEYSPCGQLIREINLSPAVGIRYPWCAIKLTNGNFLVSHGHYEGELHRVCVVDAKAKLKKSFGGEHGATSGNVKDPVYLVIDGNGFVMVADRDNSRVLLLDSDLRFKREILSKKRHGLGHPCVIYLDEENGRLFLLDNRLKPKNNLHKHGPISIFDF